MAALAACTSPSTPPQSVGAPDPLAASQSVTNTIPAERSENTGSSVAQPGTTRLAPTAGLEEAWRGDLAEPFGRTLDEDGVLTDGSTLIVAGRRSMVAFDIASGEKLWSSALALSSISRPIDDRIMTGVLVAATQPHVLSAIDVRTGRAVWQAQFANATECSTLGAPRSATHFVYVTFTEICRGSGKAPATITAVDLRTGQVAWQRTLDGARGDAIHAPPLASDGMVVVGAIVGDVDAREGRKDAYFAFDARTGTRRWVTQFDRHPDNGVILTRAPAQHGDVVVVHELSVVGDIPRPTGIDEQTGRLRWQSEMGNDVLVGGALVGLDLVRQNPQQALVPVALDAATGMKLWRNDQLRGTPLVDLARDTVLYSGARVTSVDPKTGTTRWSVAAAAELPGPIAFRFSVGVSETHILAIATTPLSNVSSPRTIMQLIDVGSGAVLDRVEHDVFTSAIEAVGDNVFLIGSTGPADPSPIIGYRLVRR